MSQLLEAPGYVYGLGISTLRRLAKFEATGSRRQLLAVSFPTSTVLG
jgi:hypothetical protein